MRLVLLLIPSLFAVPRFSTPPRPSHTCEFWFRYFDLLTQEEQAKDQIGHVISQSGYRYAQDRLDEIQQRIKSIQREMDIEAGRDD